MSHLSLETIARLVDENPTALDRAHLDACATCSAELAAMRADVASLAALPGIAPSPGTWDAVATRLRSEGLLQPAVRSGMPRSYVLLARAAAIAAVFLGGALVGRSLQDTPPSTIRTADAAPVATQDTTGATDSPQATSNLMADGLMADGLMADGLRTADGTATPQAAGNATDTPTPRTVAMNGGTTVTPVSDGPRREEAGDAALRELREAEDRYFARLSQYSEQAGTIPSDPTTRLAALEAIVLTTGAALRQAPTDPVINGYHLTALAQRDAMLKQIRTTPVTTW